MRVTDEVRLSRAIAHVQGRIDAAMDAMDSTTDRVQVGYWRNEVSALLTRLEKLSDEVEADRATTEAWSEVYRVHGLPLPP